MMSTDSAPQGADPSPVGERPTRYRCNACGNLTRFDVTSTRRTRSFHHYSLAGDLEIEDTELIEEHIEDVSCRWCNSGSSVVSVEPAQDGPGDPPARS